MIGDECADCGSEALVYSVPGDRLNNPRWRVEVPPPAGAVGEVHCLECGAWVAWLLPVAQNEQPTYSAVAALDAHRKDTITALLRAAMELRRTHAMSTSHITHLISVDAELLPQEQSPRVDQRPHEVDAEAKRRAIADEQNRQAEARTHDTGEVPSDRDQLSHFEEEPRLTNAASTASKAIMLLAELALQPPGDDAEANAKRVFDDIPHLADLVMRQGLDHADMVDGVIAVMSFFQPVKAANVVPF